MNKNLAVLVIAVLAMGGSVLAESLIFYNETSGDIVGRNFISETGGDGGLIISGTSDGLGSWATGFHAILGDLDGDGTDGQFIVNDAGSMYTRDFVPDVAGDGGLVIAASTQDALGTWGVSSNYDRMLGDLNGNRKDSIVFSCALGKFLVDVSNNHGGSMAKTEWIAS